jgi:hypothetical protein
MRLNKEHFVVARTAQRRLKAQVFGAVLVTLRPLHAICSQKLLHSLMKEIAHVSELSVSSAGWADGWASNYAGQSQPVE